jgi:hypothetical protein
MKKIFTVIILSIVTCELFSQESNMSEVLIVYIHSGWNKEKKVTFYTINPDPGVVSAADLYQLKSIRELLPADEDPDYYAIKKERFRTINQDSIIYNYFETESAALNFIVSKKWRLFSVAAHITSKEEHKDAIYYSNTYSIPKYIFVKSE